MSREFSTNDLIGVRDKTGVRTWGESKVISINNEIAQNIGDGNYKLLAFRDPEIAGNIWLQLIPRAEISNG